MQKRLENLDMFAEYLGSRIDAVPRHVASGPGTALYEPHLDRVSAGDHDDRNLNGGVAGRNRVSGCGGDNHIHLQVGEFAGSRVCSPGGV
ncbi:MAG TPA: hypothetical protein VLG10_01355, partial [Methylomirabilota bacterium]|nr:hypothetical protein [Methylomirabilota bacterium]